MIKSDIPAAPEIELGVYRHYRGNLYEVVGVACDSETLEWRVAYKPLYEHKSMPDLWVRPYEMFVGTLEIDGVTIKRFTRLDNEA